MGDFLPILTFPKGRNRLLRILVLAPTYPPPKGRDRYHRLSGCLIISNLSITKVTCIHKAVIRNFAPPKFRKVKPPTKNTINKECKCGKNREAFINFVVETKK